MNGEPYLPAFDPGPYAIPEHRQFWRFCAQSELRFQQCRHCLRLRHPPAPICAHCHSDQSEWILAPDDAFLFSFTIVHHATHLSLVNRLPYNIAIVGFASLEPTRIVSNVIDCEPERLRIGMPLELVWQASGDAAGACVGVGADDSTNQPQASAADAPRPHLPLFRPMKGNALDR